MTSQTKPERDWGNQYRLVAAEKWKAKSAVMGQPVTDALVEYARPKAGMRVLDLAPGTGEPAISLAGRVGDQGYITALDLSADLLEIARNRAHAQGLSNLATQQADAHSLPFPDNSFDLATSRFGVMFFRDPELAMRELRRVLRPNACACFLVRGPFEQPYWQSMIGVVHRLVGGPLLDPGGPNPFRFAESGSLSAIAERRIPRSGGRQPNSAMGLAGPCRRSVGAGAGGRGTVPSNTGPRASRSVATDSWLRFIRPSPNISMGKKLHLGLLSFWLPAESK